MRTLPRPLEAAMRLRAGPGVHRASGSVAVASDAGARRAARVRSQPVRPAGVAQSEAGAPEPGEARLLASGALAPAGRPGERPARAARDRDGAGAAPVGRRAGRLRARGLAGRLPAGAAQQRGQRRRCGRWRGASSRRERGAMFSAAAALYARGRAGHRAADRRGRARDRRR